MMQEVINAAVYIGRTRLTDHNAVSAPGSPELAPGSPRSRLRRAETAVFVKHSKLRQMSNRWTAHVPRSFSSSGETTFCRRNEMAQ